VVGLGGGRQVGAYDRRTLALLWWAWDRTRHPLALVYWLRFRRDLGWPAPKRWHATLMRPDMAPWLGRAAIQAVELCGQMLPDMAAQRQAFADWLRQRCTVPDTRDGRVCVVGNAASLQGLGLGADIDAAAVVVRFNRWQGGLACTEDVGRRCDVWVVAPDHCGEIPPGVALGHLHWAGCVPSVGPLAVGATPSRPGGFGVERAFAGVGVAGATVACAAERWGVDLGVVAHVVG